MKKVFLLFVFILSAFSYTEGWYTITSQTEEPIQRDIQKMDNTGISVSYSIPGFNMQKIIDPENDYWYVFVTGAQGKTDSTGLPMLPVIENMTAMPECSGFNISATMTDSVVLDSLMITPYPTMDTTDTLYSNPLFLIDSTFYNSDTLYPDTTCGTTDGYIRKQKVLQYTLYPFRYNAMNQQLTVYTEIDLSIDFVSPSGSLLHDLGWIVF